MALFHLLFHTLQQSHSGAAGRKVAIYFGIPLGQVTERDPSRQSRLLIARKRLDRVLDFGHIH
jgi:hypothetical protein